MNIANLPSANQPAKEAKALAALSKSEGRARGAITESFHTSGSALDGPTHKGGMIMDYQNITTAKELLVEMDRISEATCLLFYRQFDNRQLTERRRSRRRQNRAESRTCRNRQST